MSDERSEQYMGPEQSASAAIVAKGIAKMGGAWSLVWAAQMTPLQWVQFAAGIAATVYSIVQTYFLLRDRGQKRKARRRAQ